MTDTPTCDLCGKEAGKTLRVNASGIRVCFDCEYFDDLPPPRLKIAGHFTANFYPVGRLKSPPYNFGDDEN